METAQTHYHEQTAKPRYRLADFFNEHWEEYCSHPKKWITQDQFRAVNSLKSCRTEKLGIKTYACDECGEISQQYHSCKHRFCPTCSWTETLRWAQKAHSKLLEIPHRHAVATLPHALNPLLKANYRLLSKVLFRASAEAVKEWMLARHRIKCGIISVQHTFGERKNWHQHIHMIVSWGGVDNGSGKTKSINSNHVPYLFLANKFRQNFLAGVSDLYRSGELVHDFESGKHFSLFTQKLKSDNWTFHFEPPMQVPQQVINYIGRYSKRFCLSERKIENIDGGNISFRYKNYKVRGTDGKAAEEICTLGYRDFFARLLQHVPPSGFQAVRHFGIYANTSKVKAQKKETPTQKQAPTAYPKANFCMQCNKDKTLINIHFGDTSTKQHAKPQNKKANGTTKTKLENAP